MKKVWISYETEYEFGQRPDGYLVSDDLEAMNAKINEIHGIGDREQFWRCSEPMEVWCDKMTFKKIEERKTLGCKNNVASFDNNEKLKLYKEI